MFELLAFLRNPARQSKHKTSNRVPLLVRELHVEQLAEVVDRQPGIDEVPVLHCRDELLGFVELVGYLTDEFLDDVPGE